RAVTEGQVFVALKGLHTDGTAFARDAIDRGAAVIVSEQPAPGGVRVPWAMVEDARLALALLAAEFYRHPSRDMQVVGITGTNGKTTTAYLIASIFETAGVRSGILGTVAYRVGPGEDDKREAPRTAPSLLNVDDPRGVLLADAGGKPVTYAINQSADITTGPLSFSLEGLSFDVRTPRGPLSVRSALVGRPNVYNILAAVAAASALDVPFDAIERGITADTRKDSDQRVLTNVDRRGAIANAIELARAGDLVLIAGKGHEKYQVIGDRTLPFDDVAVAREALERRRTGVV